MADPIHNPGIPPIPPTANPIQKPTELGNEEAGRSFSLPPSAPEKGGQTPAPASEKPTPMEVARDAEQEKRPVWTQQELQGNLQNLQDRLATTKQSLADPKMTKNLTDDHYTALSRLVDKMSPDMRTIAKVSGADAEPVQKTTGEGVIGYVSRWIDGSQNTLASALDYASQGQKPDPAGFLKMQFAVQRATQRAELFSSILGAGVSGIKTIMSTQLG